MKVGKEIRKQELSPAELFIYRERSSKMQND